MFDTAHLIGDSNSLQWDFLRPIQKSVPEVCLETGALVEMVRAGVRAAEKLLPL
jgi:hypothetical protein